MNVKPILIDCSLTGGRGPAKKAQELIQDLELNKMPYLLLTDRGFKSKLKDLGLRIDYVINTDFNQAPQIAMKEFYKVIKDIDYSFMVKFGARVAGPTASRKLKKPYFIVDGGLPDYLSEKDDFYSKKTFKGAEKYLLTTQFQWEYPKNENLDNVQVCCYPISQKTIKFIEKMKNESRSENFRIIKSKIDGPTPKKNELLVNLVMTGDYLNPENRVSHGGWLTARQYDQSVGFVRRLFTDLGEKFEKIFLFMDVELKQVVNDLIEIYPNVNIISFKDNWNFEVELRMKTVADITISRATNYQPYIAALEKGCNVTSPVPADGYMDEDSAGEQYSAKGLTKLIKYDDEDYAYKLKNFIKNKAQQKQIKNNLRDNKEFLMDENCNKIIINYFKNLISSVAP